MKNKNIREKFKQLKYQHLKKFYHKNLNDLPENCKYNKFIKLPNGKGLNICGFNFDEEFEVDLCYKPEHAKNCNAFCPKKTKEELNEEFLKEIANPKVRATKYKDINTLCWIDPSLVEEEFPESLTFLDKLKLFFSKLFN